MDIALILRIVKSLTVALLLYFSLIFLGFPKAGSLIFALVPFVFGSLNIMMGFAYSMAGIVFFIAALTALFPGIPDFLSKSGELVENASFVNADEPINIGERVELDSADSKTEK